MTTRAHAIEALQLVTAGGVRWSSAWWQEGEIVERHDTTPHRDECAPNKHLFRVRGAGNVARCAICGATRGVIRLDALPQCEAMVKGRGLPMKWMRRCKGRAADGHKVCWTHLHLRDRAASRASQKGNARGVAD